MLWIVLTLAHASSASFHPGTGDAIVRIEDGQLDGVPVRITGTVLARVDDLEAIRALPGVAEVTPLRGGRVVSIQPATGVGAEALSNELFARDDVAWAHPDLEIESRPRYVPDDPLFGEQWHLVNDGQHGYTPGADLNLPEAWDLTTGAGQLVAILDTGIDPAHPDIVSINGYDYVGADDDSTPVGDDPHGTACAGLAAGIGDNAEGTTGVAYDAEAYSIRLVGNSTLTDMYNAFVEATDAGASVLSNSWGFDDGCATIPMYGVIEDAVNYAETEGRDGLGTIVVFSAGNGNCDITNDGLQAHPAVVSVAASDGYDVREGYSSFGPWVDIAAPSGRIATTDMIGPIGYNGLGNDYTDAFSGTSASAPMISGIFALMFSANERLSAAEAREALCATAVKIDLVDGQYDEDGWSPYYGCGRADAGAAVRAVANLGPPEVPVPIGPEPEVLAGNVTLQWTAPLDPDDDWLTYRVRYWYPDYPELDDVVVDTERPWLTLDDETAGAGATIAWKVRAVDLWGAGEWSEDQQFAVVVPDPLADQEEKGGCSTAPAAATWLFLPLLAAIRRR